MDRASHRNSRAAKGAPHRSHFRPCHSRRIPRIETIRNCERRYWASPARHQHAGPPATSDGSTGCPSIGSSSFWRRGSCRRMFGIPVFRHSGQQLWRRHAKTCSRRRRKYSHSKSQRAGTPRPWRCSATAQAPWCFHRAILLTSSARTLAQMVRPMTRLEFRPVALASLSPQKRSWHGRHLMTMRRGSSLFKEAVHAMAFAGKEALKMSSLHAGAIDWWIPHQANSQNHPRHGKTPRHSARTNHQRRCENTATVRPQRSPLRCPTASNPVEFSQETFCFSLRLEREW